MHAEMWHERLRDEPRFSEALRRSSGRTRSGSSRPSSRAELEARFELGACEPVERGAHDDGWPALWEEMTEVRRSVPGASW